MNAFLEKIVEECIEGIRGEGERVLRDKALSASLTAIRGARRLLLLACALQFSFLLWAMSLFAGVYSLVEQHSLEGHISLTPTLALCSSVFAVCTVVAAITLREKTWTRALGLERAIDELSERRRARARARAEADLREAELLSLVERAIDRRLVAAAAKPPADVHPINRNS